MHHISSSRSRPAILALVLAFACLALAACGSSSTSTTVSATTSASTGAPGAGARGAGASRFKALRECLQKNGVTLPARTPGQRPGAGSGAPGGAGGFLGGGAAGGGPKLPNGVTRAQYEAAIKKCGGGAFRSGAAARLKNPAYLAALTKFAACMRENGVNVPAPNTSGNGPIFDTKGIDTFSSQFRTAESKCRSDLTSAFHRGSGPGGPPSGGSARGGETTTG